MMVLAYFIYIYILTIKNNKMITLFFPHETVLLLHACLKISLLKKKKKKILVIKDIIQ